MKFVLSIELGNDAMRSGYDVAEALRGVAEDVESFYDYRTIQSDYSGIARDANGNVVLRWSVES